MLVTAGGLSPLSQPAPCLPSSWSQYSPCFTFSWSLSACAMLPFQLITVSMYYDSLSACILWVPFSWSLSVCAVALFQLTSQSLSFFKLSWSLSACWCTSLLADITVSLFFFKLITVSLLRTSFQADYCQPAAVPPFQLIQLSICTGLPSRWPCLPSRWSLSISTVPPLQMISGYFQNKPAF